MDKKTDLYVYKRWRSNTQLQYTYLVQDRQKTTLHVNKDGGGDGEYIHKISSPHCMTIPVTWYTS